MRTRLTIAIFVSLFLSRNADAQTAVTSGDVLASFAECRAITDAARRLACFERAADALEAAVRSKDIRLVDRQDVRKARRSLFGFTVPRLSLFGNDDRDEPATREKDFEELNTTIAGVRSLANNRVELRLADADAVWVTTDPMPFPPKVGKKVRIRQGALRNYFIAIAGERTVRGMRIR